MPVDSVVPRDEHENVLLEAWSEYFGTRMSVGGSLWATLLGCVYYAPVLCHPHRKVVVLQPLDFTSDGLGDAPTDLLEATLYKLSRLSAHHPFLAWIVAPIVRGRRRW